MDVIKERMVATAPRYRPDLQALNVDMVANVHDALLDEGPHEVINDPAFQKSMQHDWEDVQMNFRVPFVWDVASSNNNWAEAHP